MKVIGTEKWVLRPGKKKFKTLAWGVAEEVDKWACRSHTYPTPQPFE